MTAYPDLVLSGSPVVCIGMFDGVHRGHQALLATGREMATERKTDLVVLTFDPHPLYVLKPASAPPMITSLQQRTRLLKKFGADHIVVKPFTQEFSELSSEQFFTQVIIDELSAAAVIVGKNFTFGHRASGDVSTLRALGQESGVEVVGMDLAADREPISSSRIRRLILEGDIESATDLLGHDYALAGVVVSGDQRGRELGYPTANLNWPGESLVPADGVYAGFVHYQGQRLASAISVGSNPQFGGESRRIEAFILEGVHWELYGHDVEFEFTQYLRPQQVFDGLDLYLTQMGVDVDRARSATQ